MVYMSRFDDSKQEHKSVNGEELEQANIQPRTSLFPPEAFSIPKNATVTGVQVSVGEVQQEKKEEPGNKQRPPLTDFEQKLRTLINSQSIEGASGTPDHILAEYLNSCLGAFTRATRARERWYGRRVF